MKKNAAAPTKFTTANADLGWEPRVYIELHPYTTAHHRACEPCRRKARWVKNYMAKVNGR